MKGDLMKRAIAITLLVTLLVASLGTTAVSARPHAPIGTSTLFYTATFSVVADDQYGTITPPSITMRVLAFPPAGMYVLSTPAFSYKPTLLGQGSMQILLHLSNGYEVTLPLRATIQPDGTVIVPNQIVVDHLLSIDEFRGATSGVIYIINT